MPTLLASLIAARRELLTRSTRPPGALLLLSPHGYAQLVHEMPAEWRHDVSVRPRELLGFTIHVTHHLPAGVDLLLMDGRGFELFNGHAVPSRMDLFSPPAELEQTLAELEQACLPQPLHFDPPEPPKVKAASFDEWLKKTAALLEECASSKR